MFIYEKKLQYPVKIQNINPKLASLIITQYGGPKCNRLLFQTRKNFRRLSYSYTYLFYRYLFRYSSP